MKQSNGFVEAVKNNYYLCYSGNKVDERCRNGVGFLVKNNFNDC